ncbi:ABC transporter substrate-binding protein [Rhodococcus globerulus]|uniref:ABC transporter substrate-binding protein n=1 Tax=Rhodococcus globerulus TaxID=33008 RepID=UPI0030163163
MKYSVRTHANYKRVGKLIVATIIGSMILSSCSSNENPSDVADVSALSIQNGIVGHQDNAGQPVEGGSLTYATYSFISSFDPSKNQSAGAQGGSEMAAIYDVLVRYDQENRTYEPQLAKSLSSSDDQLTWTLTLRDGVTFNDGTPLDSRAVMESIERFNTNRGLNSQVWTTSVSQMSAPDSSTVVFTLREPWQEFPAMLAGGHGMIVAPSAIVGNTVEPIGAGPFTVERFAPNEVLLLQARTDYWGGRAHLNQIRFVPIVDDKGKVDALKTGEAQVAYLRSPDVVAQLRSEDFAGYVDTSSLGNIVQINNRPGRPGNDVRVRQAIAYATDVDIFDTRANNGQGLPGAEIFQPWSEWHNDVAPLGYEPAKAKQLLEAAMADGYNGHITYTSTNSPIGQAQALAVQAMLQAVGFTLDIDYQNSAADMSKKVRVQQDFDLAFSGLSLYEIAPYIRLYSALDSESTNNVFGYNNPDMDAALVKVQSAKNDDEKRTALAGIQTLVNETSPFITLGALTTFIPWTDDVHGIQPTLDGILLLNDAWLAP